ncbi:hypothetical protein KW791_03285 [Candidatus Parcubacteria bacterium]|nr:hypothetical protein [Candidatus Parcubacteria bacterium]
MKVTLVCEGSELLVVETTREPRIGARFESGKPNEILRIKRWISPDRAEVEVITETPLQVSDSDGGFLIRPPSLGQRRKIGF